jgi:hypothetical protein
MVSSLSACAPRAAVRERHLPLAGENENQLDAYAARYREARIACRRGYGEAEHQTASMPEPAGVRKRLRTLPLR